MDWGLIPISRLALIAIFFPAAANLVIIVVRLLTTIQLQLLASRSICLIHLMFNLAHPLSLLNTELFTLLVPTPFVDLALAQASLL